MKTHTWTTEEVDGGPCGVGEFHICQDCGASGGPVWEAREAPTLPPFLAGTGLQLSTDCDIAKAQIEAYNYAKSQAPTAETPKASFNGLKPNTHHVLSRAVEEGVRYGYNRAHKHVENPDENHICNEIEEAVMNAIYEWFDTDE